MVKDIVSDEKETVTVANLRYTEKEIATFDKDGNFKCVRCGWTHTTTECAELRLVHANQELDKVMTFVHRSIGSGHEGESPVDTFIRGYKRLYASWTKSRQARGESTEVTDLMKEE
jgi:hypothetical protein